MIWLTWRQHRGAVMGVAALLAVLGGVALITGLPMHNAYHEDVLPACQQASRADACEQIIGAFRDRFGVLPTAVAGWLNILPAVLGVLIGAPLLAREYEQGTWQLAWTQTVTRTRWLVTRLALVFAAVALAAVALSALLGWWLRPLVSSPFSMERYNYAAPVLSGYFALALAVGILAGTVIKRAIPAMVATLAVFLPIRLGIEFWLRPRYKTPITSINSAPGGDGVSQHVSSGGNWVLDTFLVGPSGNRLTDAEEFDLLGGVRVDEATMAQHGLRDGLTYHPAARFWEFQLIETAILGSLALVLLVIVIWRVRAR